MKELIRLLNDGWRVVKSESIASVNIVMLTKNNKVCCVVESPVTGAHVVECE